MSEEEKGLKKKVKKLVEIQELLMDRLDLYSSLIEKFLHQKSKH